jgi:hypothetical protein
VITFLIFWVVNFSSLVATLSLLSWIYNIFGGDLGLSGWKREAIIAVVVSFLQALLFWLSVSALGVGVGRMFFLTAAGLFVAYKLTHSSSSLFEGTYAMDNGAIFAIAAVQFAIHFGLGILLAILASKLPDQH